MKSFISPNKLILVHLMLFRLSKFDCLSFCSIKMSDNRELPAPLVTMFRKKEKLFCLIINQQYQYCIAALVKSKIAVVKDFSDDERFSVAIRKLQLNDTNHKWKWDERLKRVVLWKINSQDLPSGPHARSLSVTMYTFKPDV